MKSSVKRFLFVALGLSLVGLRKQVQLLTDLNPQVAPQQPPDRELVDSIEFSASQSKIAEDSCLLSQTKVNYRYPRERFEKQTGNLIVGVLSYKVERRDKVRQTWGRNRNNIFFVIAGDWTDELEQELLEKEDLIWIDRPEVYRGLTYKTQFFLTAVAKHLSPYGPQFLFKTDDDSYVNIDKLENLLERSPYKEADYVGALCHKGPKVNRDPAHKNYESRKVYPNPYYQDYADGLGYAVSRQAAACMRDPIEKLNYFANEDVATGILAEKCNITCIPSSEFLAVEYGEPNDEAIIRRHIEAEEDFREHHARTCSITPSSVSCKGEIPVQVVPQCLNGTGTGPAWCYTDLEKKEKDILRYHVPWWFKCRKDGYREFYAMPKIESLQSHHHDIHFARDPKNENVCYSLGGTIHMCDSFRPQYNEMLTHYTARFVKSVKRVLFVGKGDSSLLHEILKYPELELVVGLGVDQTLTRYSFKNMGTQPHFDNPKVEWWYGYASKSLAMLPSSYYGTFDMILFDDSPSTLTLPVIGKLNTLQSLSLLLKADGVLAASVLAMDWFSQVFQYSAQINYHGIPVLCSEHLVLGSNGVDFLNDQMVDHSLEGNLYIKALSSIADPYEYFHDYRHNPSAQQLCRYKIREPNPSTESSSPGILMIIEVEGTDDSLTGIVAVLTAAEKALTLAGLHVVSRVESTVGDRPAVTIVLEEGYVAVRTWPEHRYAAVDIHLWSAFERHDIAKRAIVEALGDSNSVSTSSYRIVAGGMSGMKGWKDDVKKRGPRASVACPQQSTRNGVDSHAGEQDILDLLVEMGVGQLVAKKDLIVAVLCGEKGSSCRSIDAVGNVDGVSKIVPLWSCPDLGTGRDPNHAAVDRMTACERELAATLTDAIWVGDKIRAVIVDPSASYAIGRVAYEMFKTNTNRLLDDDMLIMSVMFENEGESWRRNLMERFRTEIIADDPNFRTEVLFNSTDGIVEILVAASSDSFVGRLSLACAQLETATSVSSDVRSVKGGQLPDVPNQSWDNFFSADDYRHRPAFDQWLSQKPLAYQVVMQLKMTEASPLGFSMDSISRAVEVAVRQMESDEISNAALSSTNGIGAGYVLVATWSGGSFTVLWNGKKQVDLNWFSYDESFDLPGYFLDFFMSQFPEGDLKIVLVDEQPRGTGSVVNFLRDLEPDADPSWAKGVELEGTPFSAAGSDFLEVTSKYSLKSPMHPKQRIAMVHIGPEAASSSIQNDICSREHELKALNWTALYCSRGSQCVPANKLVKEIETFSLGCFVDAIDGVPEGNSILLSSDQLVHLMGQPGRIEFIKELLRNFHVKLFYVHRNKPSHILSFCSERRDGDTYENCAVKFIADAGNPNFHPELLEAYANIFGSQNLHLISSERVEDIGSTPFQAMCETEPSLGSLTANERPVSKNDMLDSASQLAGPFLRLLGTKRRNMIEPTSYDQVNRTCLSNLLVEFASTTSLPIWCGDLNYMFDSWSQSDYKWCQGAGYKHLHFECEDMLRQANSSCFIDFSAMMADAKIKERVYKSVDEIIRSCSTTSLVAPSANSAPGVTSTEVAQASYILSQTPVVYRYPRARFESLNTSLIIGVLSYQAGRRQLLRETWAKDRDNVFFIVAGNWTDDTEKEFVERQDLLWIDRPEAYRGLTYKTQGFMTAFVKHVKPGGFKYLFKTDDDSYVNVDKLEKLLQDSKYQESHYLGGMCHTRSRVKRDPTHKNYESRKVQPNPFYEPYADGVGYAISSWASSCMVGNMPGIRYLSNEDVATGELASRCNIPCVSTVDLLGVEKGTSTAIDKRLGDHAIIQPHMKHEDDFREEHARQCSIASSSISCQGKLPVQVVPQCQSSRGTGPLWCYTDLEKNERDTLKYKPSDSVICTTEDETPFDSMRELDSLQSHHHDIIFAGDPKNDNVCYSLGGTIHMCDSFRPQYNEMLTHYTARFVKSVKRVLFVGKGDSSLLHEILKYPELELVVGLGVDQTLTRYSFKNMGTQPHFDNPKVEWWYGYASKSLAMLPSSYYGTFDMILFDDSPNILLLPVIGRTNTLQSLSLLLKADGVLAASVLAMDWFSQVFQYSAQINYHGIPVLCSEHLVLGSNGVDFLNDQMVDHSLEGNLYIKALSSIADPYEYFHDYRHNPSAQQLCRYKIREPNPSTESSSPGILMIIEVEGTDDSLTGIVAVLTAAEKALTLAGLHVVSRVESTVGDRPAVTIVLEEGYVAVRTWPEHRYAAVDIHLWSAFERHDIAKRAIVEALGDSNSVSTSSYRIVAGGMYGTSTWKADSKQCGPRAVGSCSVPSAPPRAVSVEKTIREVIVEERLNGVVSAGTFVVVVLCGEKGSSCRSIDAVGNVDGVSKIVPLWSCPDLGTGRDPNHAAVDRMTACERELAATLTDAIWVGDKIRAVIVDPSASYAIGRVAYEMFKTNTNRLLDDDMLIMSVMFENEGESWRRNLMERFRTEIIADDPNFRTEVLFNSTESSIEVDICTSAGEKFVQSLVSFASSIEAKTSLSSDIRLIKGGQYVEDPDRTWDNFFGPEDYDHRPAFDQWSSQKPLAYQVVMQLQKADTSSLELTLDNIRDSVEGSLKQMESDDIAKSDLSISTDAGSGCLMVTVWSGGSFAILWDGMYHIDVNWFSYDEHFDLPGYFLDFFMSHFPEEAMKIVLVDEQPRGIGHVVNFWRDLEPHASPHWAKYNGSSTADVAHLSQLDSSIETSRRLEYVHITKVGGTALEDAALTQEDVVWGRRHFPEAGWKLGPLSIPRSIKVPYYGEPWHTPPHWTVPHPYYGADTFAVVRNPYTRYVSEYFCEWYPWNSPENVRIDDAAVMNKWIQTFIRRNRDEKQNGHMLPQHYYIYDEKTGQRLVDHVLKYEVNLPKSFARLVSTYGLSITLAEKKASSRKTSILNLTSETIQLINEYASKDFELLNYTKVSSANEFTDIDGSVSGSAPLRAAQEKSPEDTPSDLMNELLLNVPFYVYDDLGLPDDVTLNGKPFVIEDIDPQNPIHSVAPLLSKHADDVFLIRAAMKHPMRTHDPTEAKLFVIPTPFNMIMDRLRFGGELCVKEHCNAALIRHVDESLSKSTWFKKNQGQDHVAVLSHWRWHRSEFWRKHFSKWKPTYIQQCNVIDFEGKHRAGHKDRAVFPSYYVGRRCASSGDDDKLHDFAMITTLKRKDAPIEFEDRMNICKWIQNETSHAMPACGEGSQCPALAQAKFGFHATGDTYGSNRPMDTILSGTVPIFTREGQYDVLPEWIDWEKISYFADVSNKTLFMQQIQDFVDDKETYNVKRLNVELNRDLFDYNTLVPFDTYMYMFLHKVHPELRRTNVKTRFNALRLP